MLPVPEQIAEVEVTVPVIVGGATVCANALSENTKIESRSINRKYFLNMLFDFKLLFDAKEKLIIKLFLYVVVSKTVFAVLNFTGYCNTDTYNLKILYKKSV